ncbi:type II toxin-antitoxin system Phd/YefM family antitoxin [Chloroflexales bacterium ZM16-3]|nr:type II toxin-antitoxin system Phd/YefM family antitoxin [Chloroflexales bacterium ZM16-3]
MKSIDLQHGVVPISRAASSLAALIKRSRADQQPIIITQKGYPSGVLLGIELYTKLQTMAEAHQDSVATSPEPEDA